jgi:hypothetical protein
MEAMDVYVAQMMKDGTLLSAGGLAPSAAAIRIRLEGGRIRVTDGPFTEAKEVIGGYSVISSGSREEVIRLTTKFMQLHLDHWPAWEGECELRELVFLAP